MRLTVMTDYALRVLMYAAIVLMAITLLVNICGAAVLRRAAANVTGART